MSVNRFPRQSRSSARERRSYRVRVGVAIITVGLGSALAVPGILNAFLSQDNVAPITQVPTDQPELGLVYSGLTPAKKGAECVGGYEVTGPGDCTHGPDAPPPGLDLKHEVAAVTAPVAVPQVPSRDTATGPTEADVIGDQSTFDVSSATPADSTAEAGPGATAGATAEAVVGPNGVVCEGDGVSGKRVQVLYVRDAATASRFGQFVGSVRTFAAGVDAIYDGSANETGGSRHLRYVTTPDCNVDIREAEVPAGTMDNFGTMISALKTLGFNRTDRKYMVFGESSVYCGIGNFPGDDRPGSNNRSNVGPHYGRSDRSCWAASVAAHELGHNLGAVSNNAPNSSKAGHCVDEFDVMCYKDTPTTVLVTKCADRAHDKRLDCNHDDYYSTNPAAGSFLATHWNVANNEFLIRDGGGGPTPTPTKTPTTGPTASPTRTTGPAPTTPAPQPTKSPTTPPSPTGGPGPGPGPGLAELRVSDTTTSSTRLSWDSAGPGTRYAILLGTRNLGTVRRTAVRIVGMRPDTDYTFQIAIRKADRSLTPYTKAVTVHTAAVVAPAVGTWFSLSNSWTGDTVGVFGGRSADGTPLVLDRRQGDASQLWKVEQVADGFIVRSKATDKCIAPLAGADVVGAPLVQYACDNANAVLRWRVVLTANGVALTSPSGLVVGISRQHFGDHRLLVLQRPTRTRYQSWTARTA